MLKRRHQAFGIEDGFVFEHEIDGAGQLDGQHGVGLELVAVHPRFEPLGQRADDGGSRLAITAASPKAQRR